MTHVCTVVILVRCRMECKPALHMCKVASNMAAEDRAHAWENHQDYYCVCIPAHILLSPAASVIFPGQLCSAPILQSCSTNPLTLPQSNGQSSTLFPWLSSNQCHCSWLSKPGAQGPVDSSRWEQRPAAWKRERLWHSQWLGRRGGMICGLRRLICRVPDGCVWTENIWECSLRGQMYWIHHHYTDVHLGICRHWLNVSCSRNEHTFASISNNIKTSFRPHSCSGFLMHDLPAETLLLFFGW